MKKAPDVSESFARSAAEAKDALQRAASVMEEEWQRLVDTVDESETVPDSVKAALDRLGSTVDEVKDFVTSHGPQVAAAGARAARQAGIPIPDEWLSESDATGGTPSDAAVDDTTTADAADESADESAAVDHASTEPAPDDTVEDTIAEDELGQP